MDENLGGTQLRLLTPPTRRSADQQRDVLLVLREWMGMGVAGIIIHNYHGSFPHSRLRLAPVRFRGAERAAKPILLLLKQVGAGSVVFLEWFSRGFNGKLASSWDVDGFLEHMTSTKVKARDVDEALDVSRL